MQCKVQRPFLPDLDLRFPLFVRESVAQLLLNWLRAKLPGRVRRLVRLRSGRLAQIKQGIECAG